MNRSVLAVTLLDEMLERDWSISDIVIASGKTKNPEYGILFLALQMYLTVDDEPGMRFGDEELDDLAKAFGVNKVFFARLQDEQKRESQSGTVAGEQGVTST